MGLVERLRNGGQPDLADMADGLLDELQKAADTFADTAKYFACLGKREGSEAYLIAEQSARAAIAKATGSNP